jgi:hypothetical protein
MVCKLVGLGLGFISKNTKHLKLGVCLLSIRLFCESGYGGMLLRERLFGIQ